MTVPRFPVVAFDLDETLLRRTTVSLFLAEEMGRGDLIRDLERRFRAHEISNRVVADTSASWFTGRSREQIWERLTAAPWIDGIEEVMTALTAAGCRQLLTTVTWRFAAQMLEARYGFDAVCGTEMGIDGGFLSGKITRYFDEHDKLRFTENWCRANGYGLADVAAVGDSRSDIPLFERAGRSVALNATPDARAVADDVVDSDDLRDLLPLLLEEAPVRRVDPATP